MDKLSIDKNYEIESNICMENMGKLIQSINIFKLKELDRKNITFENFDNYMSSNYLSLLESLADVRNSIDKIIETMDCEHEINIITYHKNYMSIERAKLLNKINNFILMNKYNIKINEIEEYYEKFLSGDISNLDQIKLSEYVSILEFIKYDIELLF